MKCRPDALRRCKDLMQGLEGEGQNRGASMHVASAACPVFQKSLRTP
jgi:hypothetical protein